MMRKENTNVMLQTQADLHTQMKALGQKYMGVRPQQHAENMFNSQVDMSKGGHAVPINVSSILWCYGKQVMNIY